MKWGGAALSANLSPLNQRREALLARMPEWRPRTLHRVLDDAAEEFPLRPFVIGPGGTKTYAEVAEESARIAAGLREQGIRAGDRVSLILANYPEYVPLKYAISRIGALAVPINIMLKAEELKYVLAQSESALLITMDSFRGVDHLAILDQICPDWPRRAGGDALPDLRQIIVFHTGEGLRPERGQPFNMLLQSGSVASSPSAPDDICDILYTSGTTGAPKGVQLTHDMLMRTAFGSAYARGFEDGHRTIFALPMFHVFGYVEGLLAIPFVGGAIIPQTRFDPLGMLEAIERNRATDALLIPAMSLALIDAVHSRTFDLSSLHFALASGGRAPPHLWRQLNSELGIVEITTGYGMTETTASTTVTRPDDPEERLLTTNGRLREVGPAADPALDGVLVDYRVADVSTGAILGTDEIGELQAKGLGVTAGYYKKPDETAAAFTADGWLKTGDLATIDSDRYITLMGRTKESYRCGGEQVLPSEVEDVLGELEGVYLVQVAPLPDDRMGEVGVAFVVCKPGVKLSEDTVIEWVRARLARFKVPRHVLFVDESEIPLTASGRAKKFELTKIAQQKIGGAT